MEVAGLLRGLGAEVPAAASIIDRGGGAAELGVPRVALATLLVETWTPEECPLCRAGTPAVKPGSRAL
jgi:orotate phosphoribosyltransferase